LVCRRLGRAGGLGGELDNYFVTVVVLVLARLGFGALGGAVSAKVSTSLDIDTLLAAPASKLGWR
jgi:hypothetical protein